MAEHKWSLADLARHLELVAEGQDIISRFIPEEDPYDYTESSREKTIQTSREKTLQAARTLRELAPFQKELRVWLIEHKGNKG